MPVAQYLKINVDIDNPLLPVFNADDGWITPSTLMLYDFRRTKCYPSQLSAPTIGTPIINLIDASVDGTINPASSGTTFSGGKMTFTGAANNFFNYGASSYDLTAQGSPDFLIIAWIRAHADKSTANSQSIMHKGATAASASGFTFAAVYNGGLGSVRFSFSNGTTSLSSTDVAFTENDTWVQFGFAFEGGKAKTFKNGALAGESATTVTKPYTTHVNAIKTGSQDAWNQFKGDVVRVGLTKLNDGKTALQRVLEDYNSNHTAIALVA